MTATCPEDSTAHVTNARGLLLATLQFRAYALFFIDDLVGLLLLLLLSNDAVSVKANSPLMGLVVLLETLSASNIPLRECVRKVPISGDPGEAETWIHSLTASACIAALALLRPSKPLSLRRTHEQAGDGR